MAENQSIVATKAGEAVIVDAPYPTLPADDYIIVRTTAVAVNPTDWKHVEAAESIGCQECRVGCDYAGVVEIVGPRVTRSFKKGDRITGPVNGSNGLRKEDGTFANYIAVKGDLQIHTPENLSDEQAATLGISITTVGQGLYQTLNLPLPATPSKEKPPILIYGGSTATGVYGIQFAKLSGLTVLTTASPRNHEYLRSLGADHVFDYNSPSAVDDIRAAAGGDLRLAWDCHSSKDSATFCAKTLAEEGGHYAALLGGLDDAVKSVNSRARTDMSLYYSVFGEPYWFGKQNEAVQANYDYGKAFWELSKRLIEEEKVKPVKVTVNQGGEGLKGVLEGLKASKEGKVSAEKLVYTL